MIAFRRHRALSRPSGRQRLAAWLGVALILVNALGAAVLPAAAADRGAAPFLAGLDGEHIVLCTPNGVRLVRLDGQDVDGDGSTGATGGYGFCAFCLPLSNAGSAALTAPAVLPLPAAAPCLAIRPAGQQRPVVGTFIRSNAARAPPAA